MRCTSACMHGVVGEAFGGSGLTKIASAMKDFCTTGAMAEIHKPGNCAHGIGHALMFSTGDKVDRALNACLYFDDPGMRYYCATGVFMELLLPERKGTPRAELHDPCDLYPDYAAACYRYRARTMLPDLGGTAKGWSWRAEVLGPATPRLFPRPRQHAAEGLGEGSVAGEEVLHERHCRRPGHVHRGADREASRLRRDQGDEGVRDPRGESDRCLRRRGARENVPARKEDHGVYHDPKLVKTRKTLDDAAEDGHAHHGH